MVELSRLNPGFAQADASRENMFFLHIPKTAGTSVSSFFSTRFVPGNTFIAGMPKDIEPANPRMGIYYGAHVNWDFFIHIKFFCKKMTFLRDPVARLYSTYNFVRHSANKTEVLRPYARASRTYNFNDWLKYQLDARGNDEGDVNGNDNVYMRCLLGASLTAKMPRLNFEGEVWPLELAKERLRKFDSCGIVEDFDTSMKVACRTLGVGLPKPGELKRKNITKSRRKSPVDDEARSLAQELTKYDQELYEYGQELLSCQKLAWLV